MVGQSPTVRQRELGKRLRILRNERNLTIEDVAEKLLISATKIAVWRRGRAPRTFAMSGTYAGTTA